MSSEQPTNNPGTFRPPSFDDNLGADVTSPGTMSLGVGQKIFTHFTLKRLLGQGAMGMVWLAHNGNLNREVALKFLPQVLASDSLVLDELRRETLRCLDLSHHHIVRVYGLELGEAGTGAGGKLAAIHMEFVDGLTLRELMHKRVKEEGKPPIFEVREITAWVEQLCDALHYAHTKAKVAHRDLKPSNIMVNSAGEAKLADFGVARKIVDNLAQVTNLIVGTGTTAYMSPQQMNGGVPHPTDDVYSLGATIFELLTSKPPFYSGDMRHQVAQVAPVTMTQRREELGFTECEAIPDVWETTVAACLSKNPEDRPQSCADVAKMLKGEAAGAAAVSFDKRGPATQRPTTKPAARPVAPRPQQQQEEEPRKGFPLMPVAITALVALLIGGGLWWKNQPPKPKGGTPGTPEASAPVTAPEAAGVAKFGSIFVKSEPPGAIVILDGALIQSTPTNFSSVKVGKHKLLFRLEGYEDERQELTVPEGEPLDVKVTLKRQAGELRVECKPDKSAFVLRSLQPGGGELRGETPFKTNLVIGRYSVTLQRAGHADFTVTNNVEREHPVLVSHEFPEGVLAIKSTPPGAAFEVTKDGKKLFAGVTPTNFSDLPAGSYNVSITKQGFQPFTDSVAVVKGVLTPVHWDSTDKLVRGGFAITTVPPGAVATIPDQAPKITPANFGQLAPGKFTVTFTLDGYEAQTKEIEVKGGAAPDAGSVALQRSTGTLVVSSKPADVSYEVQPVAVMGPAVAAKKGTTKAAAESLTLPTGTYRVALSRPGWPTFSREVTLGRGQSAPITHEFEQGTLNVQTKPAGAKLTVNRQPVSQFPLVLPPGPVEIVASLGGSTPNLTNNVALEKDQPLALTMVFPGTLHITTEPANAEVFIEGKSRGKASPMLALVGLTPGDVKFEVRSDGHHPRTTNVMVNPGELREFKVMLAKIEAPKPPPVAPPTPKPTPPPEVKAPPVPVVPPVQVAKAIPVAKTPPADAKAWKNSLGMDFVAVPKIAGLICIHETRVQDYRDFAKETEVSWEAVAASAPQGDDHPAVNVAWPNARAYCVWLTARERKAVTLGANQSYRLPTDLEWSAAVGLENEKGTTPADRGKGAPKDRAPWGDTKDAPPPKGAGNYAASLGSDTFPATSPVKSFKPNQFGLYDLGGNAWEWCEDAFANATGVNVMRGGSWKTDVIKGTRPTNLQMLSGMRFPGAIATDDTGFRIVLDLGK